MALEICGKRRSTNCYTETVGEYYVLQAGHCNRTPRMYNNTHTNADTRSYRKCNIIDVQYEFFPNIIVAHVTAGMNVFWMLSQRRAACLEFLNKIFILAEVGAIVQYEE